MWDARISSKGKFFIMANILNPDSRVMTGINKVVDMIWMSVLWCLFCLPLVWIFFVLSYLTAFGSASEEFAMEYTRIMGVAAANDTEIINWLISDTFGILMIEMLIRGILIGPSTAALYYTMVKVVRRERGYATKTFFHGFKVNFKTGAPASLLFVILGILLAVDFRYVDIIEADNPTFSTVLNIGLIVVSVFVLLILVWIFPLLSRFTVSLRALFKNAMLISIRHFVGSFILGGGLVIVFWLLFTFAGEMLSILILFPFILPSAIALVSSFIIEPVLKKYTGSVNQKTRAASSESESGEESTESETSESETDGESTEGEGSEETDEENNSVDEWYME